MLKLFDKYGLLVSGMCGLMSFMIGLNNIINIRYNMIGDKQLLQFTDTPMATSTSIVAIILGLAVMIIPKIIHDRVDEKHSE